MAILKQINEAKHIRPEQFFIQFDQHFYFLSKILSLKHFYGLYKDLLGYSFLSCETSFRYKKLDLKDRFKPKTFLSKYYVSLLGYFSQATKMRILTPYPF